MSTEGPLGKFDPGEPIFVLRAKDMAAPAAIRRWVYERIRLGLNKPSDPEVRRAERMAMDMVDWAKAREEQE